jgi:hypothetical protein
MSLARITRYLVSALIICVCIDARAQSEVEPININQLVITLDGACNRVTAVDVVMSGDEDQKFFDVHHDSMCTWTATSKLKFDAGLEYFSLRLQLGSGHTRTTCKQAIVNGRVGNLLFHIDREGGLVEIATDPQIAVSYVRGVPKHNDLTPSQARAEGGQRLRTFPDVWFDDSSLRRAHPAETFRLELGRDQQDPTFPGLIVNDPVVIDFLKNRHKPLGIDDIAGLLCQEGNEGKLSRLPGLSSNAIDADMAMLDTLVPRRKDLNVSLTVNSPSKKK